MIARWRHTHQSRQELRPDRRSLLRRAACPDDRRARQLVSSMRYGMSPPYRSPRVATPSSTEKADSAVDVNRLRGDECSVRAQQEGHQSAHIGENVADALQRNTSQRLRVVVGRELFPFFDAEGLAALAVEGVGAGEQCGIARLVGPVL